MKASEFIELYHTETVKELSDLLGFIIMESDFFPKKLRSLLCEKQKVIVYIDRRMTTAEKDYCLLIQMGRWLIEKEILDEGETPEKFVCEWIEKKLEI